MDVIVAAYGSSSLQKGAAHVIYGTNDSAAYHASYLDLGSGGGGGLDGLDGFTLVGIRVEIEIYAKLVMFGSVGVVQCTVHVNTSLRETLTFMHVARETTTTVSIRRGIPTDFTLWFCAPPLRPSDLSQQEGDSARFSKEGGSFRLGRRPSVSQKLLRAVARVTTPAATDALSRQFFRTVRSKLSSSALHVCYSTILVDRTPPLPTHRPPNKHGRSVKSCRVAL